jgi:hypothetical protein
MIKEKVTEQDCFPSSHFPLFPILTLSANCQTVPQMEKTPIGTQSQPLKVQKSKFDDQKPKTKYSVLSTIVLRMKDCQLKKVQKSKFDDQ